MRTVYLGLGTNLDDRDAWLDQGLRLLEDGLVQRRAVAAMSLSRRCLLYTSPSPRDREKSRMPSSA